jgi:hypothetical protein
VRTDTGMCSLTGVMCEYAERYNVCDVCVCRHWNVFTQVMCCECVANVLLMCC